jgi:hypothetical protein
MTAFTIAHYDGMDNTPALTIALRGRLAVLEKSPMQELGLHHSYQAITATRPGATTPDGVIVWFEQKEQHRIWLQLGWVEPSCRAFGVYTALWSALCDKARELKCQYIDSGTDVDNTIMREVARRQGRCEVGILLRYEVRDVS